ncbi:1,4-dihydroxy-2-naphthoate polyprenyltransferase [Sinomicrobium weinanense]|uniref:1,4-dihydroxy-2-naphthoate octaprenyltransferase n=1 Tax=Sinomicrobium weinanense TaxID=2842200 RepID=A0A926JTY2_9FLAO|nr:1,4-dihydroxy-2-naphthoate polyprenyltransferase [Sinomicrobium weinanense]MBC9797264.1 1,4-dihydroxy-2-naphthoate polyprenyltransferase [Sinomicrobium weinanense]MBU3122334.1 1,4-dihydroxy-2-naphthoate polyprenyltransferase [Sinomicrobium weinanense]
MSKTKAFISAARLRTLPLSLSGIIAGTGIAASRGFFDWKIFVLALFTTVGFQVLSNFANDYGDGVKGTDNDDRVGPQRALQSGTITAAEMKRAMAVTIAITMLVALLLIYVAFGKENFAYSLLFFILGVASIVAAIKYTVGKSAYGYHGLGDVFVFLFFGLLSVAGSYFLYVKNIDWTVFLPATSIGLLSVGVLNLNNMRDERSDAKSGKNTLVVKIGGKKAKQYHITVLIVALLLVLLFALLQSFYIYQYLFLLAFVPVLKHIKTVRENKIPEELDPELKKLAISTFLLSVLLAVGAIL